MTTHLASPLLDLIDAMVARFPGRRPVVQALALADVCGLPTNVLLLGPPGTAKTTLTRCYASAVGHSFGARAVSAWTDEAAFLGAIDVGAVQAGVMRRVQVPGLLTTASLYLVDEGPRAGRGIKDLLLSATAERLTPDGDTVPAHVLVMTANTRLVDEDDRALADRFALRVDVPRVAGPDLRKVILRNVPVDGVRAVLPPLPVLDPSLVASLRVAAEAVSVPSGVGDALLTLAELLRLPAPQGQRHPDVSERRWVLATSLLQAAATLDGRVDVSFDDMLQVLPMVLDDGEDTRPAIASAIAAAIPAWVSALADVRAACDAAVTLAKLIEVERAPTSPAQSQAHAAREDSLGALAAAMTEHGADARAEAQRLVRAALEACDDAVEAGLLAAKARRRS